MKAIRIHEHGSADVLKIDNIPEPKCQENLVKVQIKATALNHLDIWVRNGLPGIKIPLPLIMGSDASGIVVEVGEHINNFNVGDKVAYASMPIGSYSTHRIFPIKKLVKVPNEIALENQK